MLVYFITQRSDRYAALCNTVSDQTLFSVALLNRHGATVRRGEGKQ